MKFQSPYDHVCDAATFCGVDAPYRSGSVADFMQDNNAPVNFIIEIGEWMPPVVGTVGVPPDAALMHKEQINRFDLEADAQGLFGKDRLIARQIYDATHHTNQKRKS